MINNRCPYCSGQLRLGYIKTRNEIIIWSPSSRKKTFFSSKWYVGENNVALGKFNYFKGCKKVAFKCDKCNKIIIDINSNDE